MLRTILSDLEPVRRVILSMLKPTDIVSLVQAIHIITTPFERRKYLTWTREAFGGIDWVNILKEEGCTITVVGKDLALFERCIKTWSYCPVKLQLLIVIKHPISTPEEYFGKHCHIFRDMEGACSWAMTPELVMGDSLSHIAVMFTENNTRVELDGNWTDKLLATQQISSHDTSNEFSNYTWYSNLHEASPSLDQTPPSHDTLGGVVSVLRKHGEAHKFLLSSGRSKAWTYVATQRGVPLTIGA